MFEVGDIVKIRREWLNPGENAHDRYIVADVNEVTQRCGIRSINSKAALPCIETVGFEMIEMIASHRFVYTVCFHRRDGKPVEEYEYHNKDDAERHFELFREDKSGLYTHIDLTETRIGLPEVILSSIDFSFSQGVLPLSSVDDKITEATGKSLALDEETVSVPYEEQIHM